MITTAHRQELNQLAARVGLSLQGRVHEGTTTLTFLAGETPLVTLVGLREASLWLHGYVSAVVRLDPSIRADMPAWLCLEP
jgi:hypothetical protein